MAIQIIKDKITKAELALLAQEQFGDFVKAVVDIEKGIMAIGGELHADMEAFLVAKGSLLNNLWGINLHPDLAEDEWVEFNSMINIRPLQGNRSRGIESLEVQKKVKAVVKTLVVL